MVKYLMIIVALMILFFTYASHANPIILDAAKFDFSVSPPVENPYFSFLETNENDNCREKSQTPWNNRGYQVPPEGLVGNTQFEGNMQFCEEGWVVFDTSVVLDQSKTYAISYNWFPTVNRLPFTHLKLEITHSEGTDNLRHNQQETFPVDYIPLGETYTGLQSIRITYDKVADYIPGINGYPYFDTFKFTEVEPEIGSCPIPNFNSLDSNFPSGIMGPDFVNDAIVKDFPISPEGPPNADVQIGGGSIVTLNDKDSNGIPEFITHGAASSSGSSPFNLEHYKTRFVIVSTNSDGSVKSYQPIGSQAMRGTGFDFGQGSDYGYLKPIGDFDGNGTSDVLVVGTDFNVLLLDDDNNNGYKVKGVFRLSSGSGNLPENILGDVLVNSYRTEVYGDADNNGTVDFMAVISSSANSEVAYMRDLFGYTLARDVYVLILMNTDGSVKEFKHFQKPIGGGVYVVAGDIDGDGVVDLMSDNSTHGGYEIILMNNDFTFRQVKPFMVNKNGVPFGKSSMGRMMPAGDVNNDGYGDVLIAAHPLASNNSDSSLELIMLHENMNGDYEVLDQVELIHADDYMRDELNNIGGSLSGVVRTALADMDNDNDLDLLIGLYNIGVVIRYFD